MESQDNTKTAYQDYTIDVVESNEQINGDILSEWQQFIRERADSTRFVQDPLVIKLQSQASTNNRRPLIFFLRDADSNIVCIAACSIEQSRFKLQLSVIRLPSPMARILKVYGNEPVYARGADKETCLNCLFAALHKYKDRFDYLYFDNLATNGPLWASIQSNFISDKSRFGFNMASPKMETVHYTSLPESYDLWQNSLGKKKRYNMKRTTRLLQESMDQKITLEKVTTPEQVPEFLNQLDTLFNKTWQAKTMGHQTRNSAEQLHYFTEIAKNGWLRSYLLLCDKKPLAFLVGYQYANVFEYMEPGYDPEYTRLSPGSVLNNLMFEDLFANDKPDIIDFGFGENQYKRVLGNAEYNACMAYLTPPGKWRMMVGLQMTLNAIYRRIYGFLAKQGWDNKIRQWLKKKT